MTAFKPSMIWAGLGLAFLFIGCGNRDSAPESLGSMTANVIELKDPTTVTAGSPSPRQPTCPGGKLPSRCGTWQGIELSATFTGNGPPGRDHGSDAECTCETIDFQIPSELPVTLGNAGTHKASLAFRTAAGETVTCNYKGDRKGGRSANATGGNHYLFERCSDRSRAGDTKRADWFDLELDKADVDPTTVQLRLGEPDVVNGVVQEDVFYSDDPLIPNAALYVPRGAAAPFQNFTLRTTSAVPPGSYIPNGLVPATTTGYTVDVKAVGFEHFTFNPVPGASCPRIELPYDAALLQSLLGPNAESVLQAQHILDIDRVFSGDTVLESFGPVTVDLTRHTVTFCTSHLSFVTTNAAPWGADLIMAALTDSVTGTVTPLDTGAGSNVTSLPTLVPGRSYSLELQFKNTGTQTWMTSGSFRVDLESSSAPSGTTVSDVDSGWFAGADPVLTVATSVANGGVARYTLPLKAPATREALNLCLVHNTNVAFGECFSWDKTGAASPGTTPVALVEICDGIDNDGVGGVDNGIAQLGALCAADTTNGHKCQGKYVCTGTFGSGPNGLTCIQDPSPEVCGDNRDNDCNDQTDEVLGADCGSCGGKTRCDGSCTVSTPSDLGASCGGCDGTVQCDGGCSASDPADLFQACLRPEAGNPGAIGACACGVRICDNSCPGTVGPHESFFSEPSLCGPGGSIFSTWDSSCDGQVEANPDTPFLFDETWGSDDVLLVCTRRWLATGNCPSSVNYYACPSAPTLCPVQVGFDGQVPCGEELTAVSCGFSGGLCVTNSVPRDAHATLTCR
ncbi:MAG TPA: hypothetical protein VHB79_19750 [Polyangiaceae bacterium]|nr:hypothetical protein [Polyangiaceae bacterium]